MMLFPWKGPREWICRACGETRFAPAATARMPCPCGADTSVNWLGISAIAAEHADPELPCPGCGTPFSLFSKGKPSSLKCRQCERELEVRSPTPDEKKAVFGIIGVVKHPQFEDVQLLERDRVVARWRKDLESSALYQKVGKSFVPEDELRKLAESPEPGPRIAVAANAQVSNELRRRLTNDPHPVVRLELAKNRLYNHPEFLEILARDPDERVRHAVATNDASSGEAIRRLAGSKEDYIRRAAASHFMCPDDVQQVLANDTCESVREALARRSSTTWQARAILAKDKADSVRNANDQGRKENDRIVASHAFPSQEELGMSDEEYNRMMTEAYRH